MINIPEHHFNILKNILKHYNYTFYIFGSRITNNAKPLSDIDLFYKEDIPEKIIISLENEFEESDLPYKVDLINYNSCDDDFKKIMDSNYVIVQKICNSTKNK
jgi:predicted nucleotidyltransferase